MNIITKINGIVLAANDAQAQLTETIIAALTGIISVMYAIGVFILAKRLISSIIFSKKEDNPDEEVAKYKKQISNTIIALVIITVVYVGLTVGFFTFIQDWIMDILGKY